MREDRKAALFLTLIGNNSYSILRSLCSPDLPSTKTYVDLADVIKKHMEPELNVLLERFKFKQCKQGEGKDIKSYGENLKKVSIHCNYGVGQSEVLRNQFIWGLCLESLQKGYFEKRN